MNITDFHNHDDPLDSFMRLTQFVLTCNDEDREEVYKQYDAGLHWDRPRHIISSRKQTYASETLSESRYTPVSRSEACLVGSWLWGEFSRDTMVEWAWVYNELFIAYGEPRKVFHRVGSILGGEIGDQIVEFSQRPDEHLSMEAFKLIYVRDEDGLIVHVKRDW